MGDDKAIDRITLAAGLTAAWLENPNTRIGVADVPTLIQTMFDGLAALDGGLVEPVAIAEHVPAVSVRKSLASPDHLISLIDGKPYKTLRRHLSGHGLTPETYRERFGLKADYPMVAPSYSAVRSAMAKTIGLGRKPGQKMPAKAVAAKGRAKLKIAGPDKG